jgi:segregation and condensation protein B
VSGGYQLVTKPELHDMIQWVRTGNSQLSPMALEVLAVIAFKQPVTRAEVEKIRGVSSERIIYSLMQQDLIIDLGRKDSPGRPIIYGTSPYFLECLGMNSLDELAEQVPVKEKITVVEINQNQENKEGEIPGDGELHK